MGELPLHIHEEILVRSKVKDLLRYKSVCKSWYSLISSDCLVKSHHNYNLKKKADNNETGDTRIVLAGPSRSDYKCKIVGSSNGLVCIRFDTYHLLVVNPSTHQVIKLKSPAIIDSFPHFGFGYDSSIDDYKVVVGHRRNFNSKYCFRVLTLRTNVWRSIVGELDYLDMDRDGVFCNGAIHRLANDPNNKLIIASFDLSKEVFKEIPSPPLRPCDYFSGDYNIGTNKDRLCIFRESTITPSIQRESWLLKNYNVQESESIWEEMLSLPPCDDSPHQAMMDYIPPNSLSGHTHIWMLEEDSGAPVFVQRVKSPSGEDHHIWLSTISECNYKYDKHVFVESLVSPHNTGNDNGNCNEGDSSEKEVARHLRVKNADAKDGSTRGS